MPGVPLPLTRGTSTVAGEAEGALVRRTVLPGGVRVLTEHDPAVRSATLGCWVGVGSRDEAPGFLGATHFLEHLLFKGTARRSALDIAVAFDAVGGEANAVTGKEHTCYYARVLDEDLPLAADVITDMVTSATLSAEDVDSERGVILEELAMNDDDPADVVHEKVAEAVLGDHPLGRPIGGTAETIAAIDAAHVLGHWRQHYTPDMLVFTAAGSVDHDALCELLQRELERSGTVLDPSADPAGRRHATAVAAGTHGAGRHVVVRRATEQANVVIGTTAFTATDERRYALSVLNAVLGGGMSSRLFQEVREKRGLAYSVYSFASNYSDSGYFGLYAGCTPGKTDQVIEPMTAEPRAAGRARSRRRRAWREASGSLRGGLVLGMEDTGSRMTRLGKAELVYGEYVSLDDALGRIGSVTAADVQQVAADLAGRPRSLAVVGPFDEDRTFRL
ncbi:putative zinc protease [Angustibacter aerolatus]|uniref:Zinc protease n=1 Tax=Angustibacter aerolatus TaxID=1162965 RepID=A0ABQ6JD70_9ACTN|nr:putative zinc protease [Angustibacter aerolatus]